MTGEESDANDFIVDFGTSGFALTAAEYAFKLALPYIMALVGQFSVTTIIRALATFRASIIQLPSRLLASFEKVLEVRCGTRSLGR